MAFPARRAACGPHHQNAPATRCMSWGVREPGRTMSRVGQGACGELDTDGELAWARRGHGSAEKVISRSSCHGSGDPQTLPMGPLVVPAPHPRAWPTMVTQGRKTARGRTPRTAAQARRGTNAGAEHGASSGARAVTADRSRTRDCRIVAGGLSNRTLRPAERLDSHRRRPYLQGDDQDRYGNRDELAALLPKRMRR